MREIKYILLTVLLGGMALAPLIFIDRYDAKTTRERKNLEEEYLSMKDYSDEVKGILVSKESTMRIRGAILITLSNGTKLRFEGAVHNYLYNEPDMSRFLEINDSIYKPANSDSVYVFRDGKEYYFILGELLNKTNKDSQ